MTPSPSPQAHTEQAPTGPTPGMILHYRAAEHDAIAASEDAVLVGDWYPMIVVSATSLWVSGHVFLDCAETLWVSGVREGNDEGEWRWPPR